MPTPDPFPRESEQERNLRRLALATVVSLLVAVGFVCWWLYEGAGYFQNEMSYAWSYGPRKGPRVPLPPGTVPRDGAGYDALQASAPPATPSAATAGAMIDPGGGGHPSRAGLAVGSVGLGAALYANECGFCHGVDGRGDTYVGQEYDPRPPDLRLALAQLTPDALFTAISDGMPTPEIDTSPPVGPRWHAFRLYLDVSERQAVIAYLRASFAAPSRPAATGTMSKPPAHFPQL